MKPISRIEKLEARFVPSPCPACAAGERFVEGMAKIVAEVIPSGWGGQITITSRCEWCGRESANSALVKDERTAELWRVFLGARDAGRLCAPEVDAVRREVVGLTDQGMLEQVGSKWADCQSLQQKLAAEMGAVRQRYEPRFPYLCAVEGCGCEKSKRAAA